MPDPEETRDNPTSEEVEVLVALDLAAIEVQTLAGTLNAAIAALAATGERAPLREDRRHSVRGAARRLDDVLGNYLRLARRRLSRPFAAPRLTWASDVRKRAYTATRRALGEPAAEEEGTIEGEAG